MKGFAWWFLIGIFLIRPVLGSEGTKSGQFLMLAPTARELALGQAGASITQGAASLYWNPAQLGAQRSLDLILSQGFYAVDTKHQFAAISWPVKAWGMGLSANYFDYGDIDQVDDVGQTMGQFTPRDLALTLGMGSHLSIFRVGGSVKWIHSKILHSDSSYSADAALSWESRSEKTRAALTAKNLMGELKFVDKETDIQRLLSLGLSHRFNRFLVSVEENFPIDGKASVHAGVEAEALRRASLGLSLRTGFNQALARDKEGGAGFSIGMGLELSKWTIDYSWAPLGELDQLHYLTVSWSSPKFSIGDIRE